MEIKIIHPCQICYTCTSKVLWDDLEQKKIKLTEV